MSEALCANVVRNLAPKAANAPKKQTYHVEDTPLTILYQDAHVVAIHKPSGLLVHRSPVDRRETRFAMALLRDQLGQWVYPVHRLDKPTSGVLLFALNPETAKHITGQFEAQAVRKRYLAVVRGYPALGGIVRHAIADIDDLNSRQKRADTTPLPALTLYHRLATCELPISVDKRYATSRYALVDLCPRTGRRHQLRRHMKHLSHPIIGDTTYGKGPHNRFFLDHFGVGRLLLTAYRLELTHPVTGEALCIQAPLDASFHSIIDEFGWPSRLPRGLRCDTANRTSSPP